MTTQIDSEHQKNDKPSAWLALKEHPIVIVLGFCATTAVAMVAIYEKLIVPYHVKVLEVQVADLSRQLAVMPTTEKMVGEKEAAIVKLREEVTTLKQRAVELTRDNVFSTDDPYPKAFRRIRIGDLFSKVEQTYPGQVTKDDPEDNSVKIEVDDFFFTTVLINYDETVKPHRVTSIVFFVNNSRASVGALKAQLTERYGPGVVGKRNTVWKVKDLEIDLGNGGPLFIRKP